MDPFATILGTSPAATGIRRFASRAADVDATVLITGESGTGKGVLARAIHAASRRARAPFVAVNCASVPESLFESEFFGHTRGAFTGAQQSHRGLVEQAHAGTLFLDEIAELLPTLQAKLLTTLDDREVRRLGAERPARFDVRFIAATNAHLQRAVRERAFRADLYHRLVVLAFHLPPLRDRADDIDLFLRHFLDRFTERHRRSIAGFEPAAYARLRRHPWPGNVRQLQHTIEAAVLACDSARIALRHLPDLLLDVDSPATDESTPLPPAHRYSFYGTAADERRRIDDVLRRCHGNRTRAAAVLGMSRNTLRAKLREAGGGAVPDSYGLPATAREDWYDASRTESRSDGQNGAKGGDRSVDVAGEVID